LELLLNRLALKLTNFTYSFWAKHAHWCRG